MTEIKSAKELMAKIEEFGFEAYIVGGYVRDSINGMKSDDVDISTNMPMEMMEQEFTTYTIGESKDFGIVIVKHEGFDFEVAQFRADIYSNKFEKGMGASSTKITNFFMADSARRDFTINSMGMTSDGEIIDYHNGHADMDANIIRAVGNPEERFEEDYVRMFRAIRFAARMDFTIEDETYAAIKKMAHKAHRVAGERIKKEFYKMASQDGTSFAKAIDMMVDTGIMEDIIPEFTYMKGFKQSEVHHPEGAKVKHINSENKNEWVDYDPKNPEHNDRSKFELAQGDVFDHVMAAIRCSDSNDPVINMGIMFHDIGKPASYRKVVDGDVTKHTYYSHETIGVGIWEDIARRMNFSRVDMDKISAAVNGHMRFHMIGVMKQSKVKTVMDNKHYEFVKEVAFADAKSRGDDWDRDSWNSKMQRIDKIKSNTISPAGFKIAVTGKMVMSWMGITRGNARVGEIIKKTYHWANDNNVTNFSKIQDHAKAMARS